jgi:hypothetical protein
MSSALLVRAGLALALISAAARTVRAQGEGLEPLLAGIDQARAVPAAAVALATLVDGRAERLFEPLVARPELTRLQRLALELALEELPHETALTPLRAAARRAEVQDEREVALAVLARLGTRSELSLALELGAADLRGEGAPRERQKALERCLAAILTREPGGVQLLCELVPRSDPSTLAPALRALAESAGDEAAARLAGMLPQATDAGRALVLAELGRVASRGVGLDDLGVSELVRTQLGSTERNLAVLACGVLEKLRDHGAVPELIVLLGDADRNVGSRAHRALGRLTGLALPPEEESWLGWLDEAMTWWDTRSEACRVALVSGSAAEAAAAVQEFARQSFRRDHVVQALELALARSEPDLVELTLATLGAIDDPRAQLALQRFREEAQDELRPSLERARVRVDQRVAAPGPRKHNRIPQRTRTP